MHQSSSKGKEGYGLYQLTHIPTGDMVRQLSIECTLSTLDVTKRCHLKEN
jgi:hypothetical protein